LKPMAKIHIILPIAKGPGYLSAKSLYSLLGSQVYNLADYAKG
jgi:hypothetical protein